MKIIMINDPEKPVKDVDDNYGLRLIEQGKAVFAHEKKEEAPAKSGKKKG